MVVIYMVSDKAALVLRGPRASVYVDALNLADRGYRPVRREVYEAKRRELAAIKWTEPRASDRVNHTR
jgi:hypothetical protein